MPETLAVIRARYAKRDHAIWEERQKGRTYESIGKDYGLCRVRVGQICRRIDFYDAVVEVGKTRKRYPWETE